jgi:DNA gyrase/topoisomerase IV subunit A
MDDGRFNKVANIIKLNNAIPPGDASIGDALVNMVKGFADRNCRKWGDVEQEMMEMQHRYIETRSSVSSLWMWRSIKTTNWQLSYDGDEKKMGRSTLPMKFRVVGAGFWKVQSVFQQNTST